MATSIEQLNQRINSANLESKRLHDLRQANLGKKTTLEQQLSASIDAYNQKYGTSISVDTLTQEVSRVTAMKEQEVTKVEQALALIQAGNFAEVEKLMGGVEAPTVEAVQQTAPQAPTVEAPSQPTAPVAEPTIYVPAPTTVEAPVAPPAVEAPIAPPVVEAPQAPIPAAPPTMPLESVVQAIENMEPAKPTAPKVNLTGIDALADFTQPTSPVAPPPVMPTPSAPVAPAPAKPAVTDFSQILSGTAFTN